MSKISAIVTMILSAPSLAAVKLGLMDAHGCMERAARRRGRLASAVRKRLLKDFGAHVGKDAFIAENCEFFFEKMSLLSIGEGTVIGRDCRFGEMMANRYEVCIGDKARLMDGNRFGAYAGPIKVGARSRLGFFNVFRGPAVLGEAVLISHHCTIVGGGHQFDKMDSLFVDQGVESATVTIGDSVWIGSSVTIVPGVTVGEHSVVGANSVVTRDVPPYCMAAGCPARVIKRYDFDKKEWMRVPGEPDKS